MCICVCEPDKHVMTMSEQYLLLGFLGGKELCRRHPRSLEDFSKEAKDRLVKQLARLWINNKYESTALSHPNRYIMVILF